MLGLRDGQNRATGQRTGPDEVGFGITHGRVWLIASGVLSIIAGVILFSVPGISLLVLAIVLGVWLVLFRVTLVARSVSLRTLGT